MSSRSVTFHVDGVPKPQPRPRAFARKMGDKFVARVFDAGTAEGWKSLIVAASRPHRPVVHLEGPVCIRVAFLLPRPARLCRRKDHPGRIWCVSKPDIDNLVKALTDCLTQEGWWRDDSQIVEMTVTKQWHGMAGRPGADVWVSAVQEAAP